MTLFRPNISRIEGYIPGEQPQGGGWVKLNTNENPYPPSPRVIEAIHNAANGRLNIYPDPLVTRFRQVAAAWMGVEPDWILPANGSDENLTILLRTFVEPGELVAYPYPSYILYETLADLQGAAHERMPLNPDWSWNQAACRETISRAKLVLVPNPNSPSGNSWGGEDLLKLVPPRGILVVDEAYGDFRDDPQRAELLQTPGVGKRIVITRTLSKSFSLAGLRFGFAVAHPELIAGMRKAKDSYNCDSLSIAGAVAALEDRDAMRNNVERIRATRGRLTAALRDLSFDVVDSQANFVWATRPAGGHRAIYDALKRRKILVRYMAFPQAGPNADETIDGLRITIGTDDEIDKLLEALGPLVDRDV